MSQFRISYTTMSASRQSFFDLSPITTLAQQSDIRPVSVEKPTIPTLGLLHSLLQIFSHIVQERINILIVIDIKFQATQMRLSVDSL
jgi:hypothetical protein